MRPWAGGAVTQLRAWWSARLPVQCPRCGRPVLPTDTWHLGHRQGRADHPELTWDPDNIWPEHARCNLAASARRTNAIRRSRRADRVDNGWR